MRSLKDKNKIPLFTIMLLNFVTLFSAIQSDNILNSEWHTVIQNWHWLLKIGAALIFTGIINAQISPYMKARLVFWRWENPWPGSEAFTRYGLSDPRIDIQLLQHTYGILPTDRKDQNTLWYRLYSSVSDNISVRYVHREFLFARDYTSFALLILIVFGITGILFIPSIKTTSLYMVLLIVQVLLATNAARNHGYRLVTTVLALKTTDK